MKVVHTINDLRATLSAFRNEGKKIGLVPTMGALHAGHASLVERCAAENEVAVVSVFLNPTQFNDKKDLEKYPRTLEADCALLEQVGATLVFVPSVEEMYPDPDTRQFSFSPIDTVMEGAFRPGHFNGVCQIVSKLFAISEPDTAYFGEKDYQQIAVIRALVRHMGLDKLQIVACPVIREANGLAMSSRNTLLTDAEREIAANISRVLFLSQEFAKTHLVAETHHYVVEALNAIDGLEVQYFSIVDGDTLQDVEEWSEATSVVGCITVFCGATPIRLIDHVRYI